MKRPVRSYLVLAVLAAGTLAFALPLSAGDRGPVDHAVLTAISAAILWNLVQLGRRLHAAGGAKAVWHLIRTVGFWVIGLVDTLLRRPEDFGTWRPYVGWILLLIAVADTIALGVQEHRIVASLRDRPAQD
ncbi:MAG: hypothetical protein IPM29_02335 [Planctomycetes bacterium]|nr:hypothetical protein [Planctomycetota bacterium]